jgi:acetyl-CoA C-acetyltransferase
MLRDERGLVGSARARRAGPPLDDKPVRLFIAAGSHTLRTGDRRPMRIPLLPHETEEGYRGLYEEMRKQDGRWPGFESFGAARFAAYMVYRMAGIQVPIEDLDLVETHDAFTISDLQTYGDVGLTLYGREQEYVRSGDCYLKNPRTGAPGRCPANLSGGLLGTMHAVGATGIFQCGEVLWQLQGKYDKFHGDPGMWRRYGKTRPENWESLQVRDPRRGLAVSHAGVGSHVTCAVLEGLRGVCDVERHSAATYPRDPLGSMSRRTWILQVPRLGEQGLHHHVWAADPYFQGLAGG